MLSLCKRGSEKKSKIQGGGCGKWDFIRKGGRLDGKKSGAEGCAEGAKSGSPSVCKAMRGGFSRGKLLGPKK